MTSTDSTMNEESFETLEAIELQNIKSAVINLHSIWEEIGFEEDQRIEKSSTVWNHMKDFIQEICNEQLAASEELKEKIRNYTEKISILSNELSVQISSGEDLTLIKREEFLHKELETLMKLKENRLKDLNNLESLEKRYRLLLKKEHKLSFKKDVPSEDDLKAIQQYVTILTLEYNKKCEQYRKAGQDLVAILEILEISPESTLEKHLCSGEEPYSLSDDTFRTIEDILTKANKRKIEAEDQKRNLVDKLNETWEMINVEKEKRLQFLSNHLDCKASTLKAMELELVRCEAIKQQNAHLFINSVHLELKKLWEKCGVSESEELLNMHSSAAKDEDILLAHEQELEKMKKYYDKVKQIIEKIEKRKELWEKLLEVENKANDPARFKNRGGNLLKEEKERKKLHKLLSHLEKEICDEIQTYESENGKQFLYLGEDYRCLISKEWKELSCPKEKGKLDVSLQVSSPVKFTTPKKLPPIRTPKSAQV